MRRDWELVRKILIKLEEQETALGQLFPDAITGYDAENVCYHMKLLDQAGLIEARSMAALGDPASCVALSLTWDGHEFLHNIKRDTIWNKVKGIAREKGLDLSVDVIKIAAKLAIQSVFKD